MHNQIAPFVFCFYSSTVSWKCIYFWVWGSLALSSLKVNLDSYVGTFVARAKHKASLINSTVHVHTYYSDCGFNLFYGIFFLQILRFSETIFLQSEIQVWHVLYSGYRSIIWHYIRSNSTCYCSLIRLCQVDPQVNMFCLMYQTNVEEKTIGMHHSLSRHELYTLCS
jgi:hypothetical protein